MFTHAMDFFQQHTSLKKPISKYLFPSILKNLSTKDLITLGNLLSTKLMVPIDDYMHLQASEHGCHKI